MSIHSTDDAVKALMSSLTDKLRAERNEQLDSNAVSTFAEPSIIDSCLNSNHQLIYGRRGTGKTHLLLAVREKLNESELFNRTLAVYFDARKFLPTTDASDASPLEYSSVFLKFLIKEILNDISVNIDRLENHLNSAKISRLEEIKNSISVLLSKHDSIEKISDNVSKKTSETQSKISINLSTNPKIDAEKTNKLLESNEVGNYNFIATSQISVLLSNALGLFPTLKLTILLDEFSEIPLSIQPYCADLLKKIFTTLPVNLKIAAIPNRTKIFERSKEKNLGFEIGADIFVIDLDNRYIYENNVTSTKRFFEALLKNHLRNHSNFGLIENSNMLTMLLADVALKEILIATAGIPRDFLNTLINSYEHMLLHKLSSQLRINAKNVRNACGTWYAREKKISVDSDSDAKKMLESIIQKVVLEKKSTHFLVPTEFSSNPVIQKLVDLRVLHLRKTGYSHQDIKTITYDVFSIDYGSYIDLKVIMKSLNINGVNDDEIKIQHDLRSIRRIALDSDFFGQFILQTGTGLICKQENCKKIIDTNAPSYVKKNLCNYCFCEVT